MTTIYGEFDSDFDSDFALGVQEHDDYDIVADALLPTRTGQTYVAGLQAGDTYVAQMQAGDTYPC